MLVFGFWVKSMINLRKKSLLGHFCPSLPNQSEVFLCIIIHFHIKGISKQDQRVLSYDGGHKL